MSKTKITDWAFNGITSICFLFGGLIWSNASAQNTAAHERGEAFDAQLVIDMRDLGKRVDQNTIDLAVMAAKNEMERKGK